MRALLKEVVAMQTVLRLWPRGQRPPVDTPEAANPAAMLEAEFRLAGMNASGDELFCNAVDHNEFLKFKAWTPNGKSGSFIATIQSRLGILFMNTWVSEVKANSVRLHAPQTLYEVQRRASLRVSIPEQITVRITLEDPHRPGSMLVQEVIDLGDGGLSFAVPETTGQEFSRGLELGTIRFTLAGRQIICQGIVRSCRKGKIRRVLNANIVGIQFRSLAEADKSWISTWVLRQSRYIVQNMRD